MAVVLDTGIVIALMDADDDDHRAVSTWMSTIDDDLVTTPLVLAEMDYFAAELGGRDAQWALWSDFDDAVYAVRWWADALAETINLARANPMVGLTDASLVALAARLRTNRIATLDHRHFRAMTLPNGQPFTVLPADTP